MTSSRFSEASFRRYESDIAQIVRSYPKPIRLIHEPLSIETYSHRLRDAIRALRDHMYPTSIPRRDFLNADIVVRIRDNEIWAGGRREAIGDVPSDHSLNSVSNLTAPDDTILESICTLMSRRLHGPVTLTGVPELKLRALEERFDVSWVKNPDNTYTLL